MNKSHDKNDDGILNNEDNFGKYYRENAKKKKPLLSIVCLVAFFIVVILTLWFGGFLSSVSGEAKYVALTDGICQASINYAKDDDNNKKLIGVNTPGKIVYVKIQDLISSNLMPSEIRDPRTNEKIDIMTDVKLSVMATDNFLCEGFAYREDDLVAPVIKLNGINKVNLRIGDKYYDPGATATDNRDGNITEKIIRSGNVNLKRKGTYYIYYSVADRAGNVSNKVVRTINVTF